MSGYSNPYSELYSPDRNDSLQIWRGIKLAKDVINPFFLAIKKLAKSWNRCIEFEGGYTEKQYKFLFLIFTTTVLLF
jgi:hypothetical protein